MALTEFLAWVKDILPEDKFKRFVQVLRAPYATLEITDCIFKELRRIFEGANPFFSYEFTDTQLSQDFEEYLETVLKDKEFFSTTGFEQLKTCINSVLIVDLPAEQTSKEPEPYYYFVQVNDIVDLVTKEDGCIQSIEFKMIGEMVGIYDEQFYTVFNVKDGVKIQLSQNTHDLGYCPAHFFWDKNLRKDNNILKKSPFTDALGKLDKYLVGDTFKEYADMYTSFPVVVAAEQICTFDGCDNGFIKKTVSYPYWQGAKQMTNEQEIIKKCPACGNKHDIGPGSFYEVPVRQSNDDPEIGPAVEFITPDVKGLEYYGKKLDQYREDIEELCLGSDDDMAANQAMNEEQVFSSFEGRKNVLIGVKNSFEKIHKWANDTVARLRYGSQRFISSRVFYGDEFFLKNVQQLMNEYDQAKKGGIPDDEINVIYWQIIQTKYKGNPNKINRSWILLNLNPEPHKLVIDCKDLVAEGAMSKNDFVIKSRFDNFIMRFEREQTNILEFGSKIDFSSKITAIKDVLNKYAEETISSSTVLPAAPELPPSAPVV